MKFRLNSGLLTSAKSNRYFKYFILFLAFPFIKIGVSITFYLFIFLVYSLKKEGNRISFKPGPSSYLFYTFFLIAFGSLVFAPWSELQDFNFGDIILLIQYMYWVLVAVFFIKSYKFIHFSGLNQIIFVGLCLLFINFFLFNFKVPIPFLNTYITRNSFVYNVLALWPFAASHIYSTFGKGKGNFSLVVVFILMLLTDGRAGVVVILLENLLIFAIFNRKSVSLIRYLVIFLIPISILFSEKLNSDDTRQSLGNALMPYSERIGNFLIGEGIEGDLSMDKSWLTRKLMIEKGFEIIELHPFFGVGIGHFTSYKAELENLFSSDYSRLTGGVYDETFYNARSAHNSYIHVMGEMGLLGLAVLVLILLKPLLMAVGLILSNRLNESHLSYIALIGICVHFYTITTLPGTITWLVIGLASGRVRHKIRSS